MTDNSIFSQPFQPDPCNVGTGSTAKTGDASGNSAEATEKRHSQLQKKAIPQGRVTIVFECAGVGPPLVIRARRLLKCAGRAFSLRTVSCTLPADDGEARK